MIQTDTSSIIYVGNESTTILYSVPFYFFTAQDLVVVVRDENGVETLQTLGTHYTVTGAGNPGGGAITFTWAVPSSSQVSISRSIEATQLTSYEEADAFPAKSHERALDKLTCLVQQALRVTGSSNPADLGRAFRVTDTSEGLNAVVKINDSTLGVDASGSAILRTANDMLAWMGQVGTVWDDTPERLNTRGAYPGQLGVQLDNSTIYIAHSTTPGDWFPFLIGTGIIAATDGVPYLLAPPEGDLVGTDESQVLYNKTLENPTINNPSGLTKNDVGLGNVDNTSDLNKPLSSAAGAALAFKQDKTEKGFSNGYASLDGGGKVPISQIPDALIGASQYQGTWNATTNTPTIPAAAVGNKGWYYSVSVAGTTNIDGINSWAVGDQIISNGTAWQKIANVSAVQSVNGKTGTVVINKADVGLSNVDNTSDATKNDASAVLRNKTIKGVDQTLMEVRLDADVINNLPVNRLNNGTGAAGTTWWCGDGSWKQPPGTGDINGPPGSVDGELCLYSGTTGKIIRRFSGTAGFAKAGTTGLLTTQAKIMGADLDPSVISAQPVKTTPGIQDSYLLYDFSTGLLKSTPSISVSRLPRNYFSGLFISNNVSDTANDIDIVPGECRSIDNSADIILSTAITKRLDAAWAAGTNQGGRDTGVIADATWHMFVIRNPSTNTVDALFSQSISAPTLPSGYTQFRRIGSTIRRGAGGLVPFKQTGDYFEVVTPVMDINGLNYSANQTDIRILPNLPSGRKTLCHFNFQFLNNTVSFSYYVIGDPDQAITPTASISLIGANNMAMSIVTLMSNSSAQIRLAAGPQSGTFTVWGSVLGWWDDRDKES